MAYTHTNNHFNCQRAKSALWKYAFPLIELWYPPIDVCSSRTTFPVCFLSVITHGVLGLSLYHITRVVVLTHLLACWLASSALLLILSYRAYAVVSFVIFAHFLTCLGHGNSVCPIDSTFLWLSIVSHLTSDYPSLTYPLIVIIRSHFLSGLCQLCTLF